MLETIGLALLAVSIGGYLTIGDETLIITDLDDSKIIARGTADLHYPFVCITKCFLWIDNRLVETKYSEPQKIEEPEKKDESIIVSQQQKELSLLVQHIDRVFWKYEYKITARVFDKKLNPFNDYNSQFGFIKNADVKVTLIGPLPEKKILTTLSGKTSNTGYYEEKFYITENLVAGGIYDVIINATDGVSSVILKKSLIIIGQVPDSDTCTPPNPACPT